MLRGWPSYGRPRRSWPNLARIGRGGGLFAKTGQLRAEAWVVHGGKRVSTAEGRLLACDGKIVAHGSTTCMVLSA
jgi:hypothetical protein